MTFSQLRDKDVINVPDGRKLGKPIDLAFCENAMIEAIVVPGPSSIWNCLSREREGCAIPGIAYAALGTMSFLWIWTQISGTSNKIFPAIPAKFSADAISCAQSHPGHTQYRRRALNALRCLRAAKEIVQHYPFSNQKFI